MSSNIDTGVLQVIQDRRSSRTFLSTPVPRACIRRILEAARLAPSGANQQPWHFVVIDDPSIKREVRAYCEAAERQYHEKVKGGLRAWFAANSITASKPFLEDAPVLIAVFFDTHAPYSIPSVWIAITHILLQATEEGLYSLPYTPSAAKLGSLLKLPDRYRIAAILPIGHADRPPRQPRFPLSKVASLNEYGRTL
ncbi:MAG: nitroreductase family protein [Candidatus Bipolaricaulota bacterium]|nr:nitroreductase family protein [Candidatus Bipolaricaulota bacterium]